MIELAGLLVLGFMAQWLAWRIKVPAILPLIFIGLAVGPGYAMVSPTRTKFIDGDTIFQGHFLFDVVSLSVGLILFEGGLTLRLKEVRTLGSTVRNMLIFGPVITCLGGAFAANWIMDLNFKTAFLFGSLIIVTGPTVIGPILRNVRPNRNITTVLKWEGILIDPIGALVAILAYDFITSAHPNESIGFFAVKGFLLIVLIGGLVGVFMAFLTYYILKRNLLPKYLQNVVILALVILTFALADLLYAEAGLLAVTLMGMVLGNLKIENLKKLLSFQEDVVLILISFLFVLLSSRIDDASLSVLLNWKSLALFATVVFVLRPLTIFISTLGSGLSMAEKLFISWISPRGIVAAGVASIFAMRLEKIDTFSFKETWQNEQLMPLTFLMVLGTVVLQGTTAKAVAKLLGVLRKHPSGVIFVGANEITIFIAKYLKTKGVPVLMTDTARSNIIQAKANWLPVYEGSILREEAHEAVELTQYGQIYAMTSNNDINLLSCRIMGSEMGEENVFRLAAKAESENLLAKQDKNLLFNAMVDHDHLTRATKGFPIIREYQINSEQELRDLIEDFEDAIIPLLILRPDLRVFPVTKSSIPIEPNSTFVYLIQQ